MASNEKDDDFKAFIREYVKEVVNEFTGAGACPGYTLPLGMDMDPESLSSKPKLKGKWKKPKQKKTSVNEAIHDSVHRAELIRRQLINLVKNLDLDSLQRLNPSTSKTVTKIDGNSTGIPDLRNVVINLSPRDVDSDEDFIYINRNDLNSDTDHEETDRIYQIDLVFDNNLEDFDLGEEYSNWVKAVYDTKKSVRANELLLKLLPKLFIAQVDTLGHELTHVFDLRKWPSKSFKSVWKKEIENGIEPDRPGGTEWHAVAGDMIRRTLVGKSSDEILSKWPTVRDYLNSQQLYLKTDFQTKRLARVLTKAYDDAVNQADKEK